MKQTRGAESAEKWLRETRPRMKHNGVGWDHLLKKKEGVFTEQHAVPQMKYYHFQFQAQTQCRMQK